LCRIQEHMVKLHQINSVHDQTNHLI